MERLWSPWRLAYLTGANNSSGCIFCDALTRPDAQPLVLYRGRTSFVILNLYPYNNGHLMVVTNRHVAALAGLSADELGELMTLTQWAEMAGVNMGRVAGAGVVDHVHVHMVPRWVGDTNFMSVIGEVRVLPEELGQTARRLKPIFERLASART